MEYVVEYLVPLKVSIFRNTPANQSDIEGAAQLLLASRIQGSGIEIGGEAPNAFVRRSIEIKNPRS